MKKSCVYSTKFFFLFFYIYPLSAIGWGELRYAQTTTNIRAERNAKSKIIGKLKPGEKVKVDFLIDNWFAVFDLKENKKDKSRAIGYVYAPLLKKYPPYDLAEINWEEMWGKSISQIMKEEKNKLIEEQDMQGCHFMIYEGYLYGHKCSVSYRFIQDELAQCSFLLNTDYKNHNELLKIYKQCKQVITDRFGAPYISRSENFLWVTPTTCVSLQLFVRNSTSLLMIAHFDKDQLPTIKKLTPGWGF